MGVTNQSQYIAHFEGWNFILSTYSGKVSKMREVIFRSAAETITLVSGAFAIFDLSDVIDSFRLESLLCCR